ncbi:MAG: T9SS type A sorting domain-containing protein [Bacteroidaceae bacterium]|nr:T9SS type A sorting domain-containing protein [Bacteroidaceae bacterium]
MKKFIFTFTLAVLAMNANAQLVVDSLGHVGIGNDEPACLLSVGDNSVDEVNCGIHCIPRNKLYGFYVMNNPQKSRTIDGVYAWSQNRGTGDIYGCTGVAESSNSSAGSSQKAVGVCGRAGDAYNAIGVFGGKNSTYATIPCVNFAGVYGSETEVRPLSLNSYPGKYAGFFVGKVRVTNGIYGTLLTPSAGSSTQNRAKAMRSAVMNIEDNVESVTEKLNQVNTLQFYRQNATRNMAKAQASSASLDEKMDIDNMTLEEREVLASKDVSAETESNLSAVQYGLAADELKAVYPELVYEDENGNVSINYIEMIPLLVQSIKELSKKVSELEASDTNSNPTGIENTASDIDMVKMDQNKPNPFSESTVIGLNIPEKAQKANIYIYDMSGKQVKNINVEDRGNTSITVYASDLNAGMYIYSLVIDGKVCVTRKMIVTNA